MDNFTYTYKLIIILAPIKSYVNMWHCKYAREGDCPATGQRSGRSEAANAPDEIEQGHLR